MASVSTTPDEKQLQFARKLASNDKDARYQAISKLATLFSKSKGPLAEDDLLKIWMGLYYAMWMSDKPLVQAELAETISKLIDSHVNPDNAILFIKTFYTTMHRQFPLLDRLRHDKFLKFVRFFVHHSLAFLKKNDYDSELIEKYIAAQTHIWGVDDAQEIQLHVCDLFFDELYLACGNEVPSAALFQLAGLFADILEKTNHAILKARLFEVLKAFISGASYCSPKLAPKRKDGMETDKSMYPDVEFIAVSLEDLCNWLLARASTKQEILNRDFFYKLKDEALKKKKAEPGFKLLPRGSIMKTVEEAEHEEYKRLMHEHFEAQKSQPKEEVLSKKERKRKRKEAAAVDGQAVQSLFVEKENGKEAHVDVPAKKNDKKQKLESAPAENKKQAESPMSTKTIVTTKKVKKDNKGEVIAKTKQTVETVVTDKPNSDEQEITTTTTTKKVTQTPQKKNQKQEEEDNKPVDITPVAAKKGKGKGKKQVEEEDNKPVDITPVAETKKEKGKGKGNKQVDEDNKPMDITPVETKKGKGKKQVEAEDNAPVDITPKEAKGKKPTPAAVPVAEAKKGKGKKQVEAEDNAPVDITPKETKGKKPTPAAATVAEPKKGKGKKVEEEDNTPVDITPKETKGKKPTPVAAPVAETKKGKGKKQVEEEDNAPVDITPKNPAPAASNKKRKEPEAEKEATVTENGAADTNGKKAKKGKNNAVTPQKTEMTTPPTSAKKSVRFSAADHVKEFDKLEAVGSSPLVQSPASTKLKGLLNAPPAKANVSGKAGKKNK